MKAIRWCGVVAYGLLHPIRAAFLVGMPYGKFLSSVDEWSKHGEITIDGWKVKRCAACGVPVVDGMEHSCLKRINRRSGVKYARTYTHCPICGKKFAITAKRTTFCGPVCSAIATVRKRKCCG